MADRHLYISEYFKYDAAGRFTDYDFKRIERIREEINIYEDEADCAKYIFQRRLDRFNREEDLKLFDIPMDAEIDEDYGSRRNRFYRENKGFKRLNYNKKDKDGNDLYDKYGNVLEHKGLARKGINFANNVKSTKTAKRIEFIASHIKFFTILFLILVGLFASLFLVVYIVGTLDSLGHTPFVLCGEDEIVGSSEVQNGTIEANDASSSQYAAQAFITIAKKNGWKNEAIVGTLSYILQEGSGLGTFTYEGYWTSKGPSGIPFDKSLDNKAWLKWLNGYWVYPSSKDKYWVMGEGQVQAHKLYKSNGSSYYAALGLGLFQSTDTWTSEKTKTSEGATQLLNWCESKGKPWQDPQTQLDYYFSTKLNDESSFDGDGANPKTSNYSAEEWCKRVSAGIGMPAWRWNDAKHASYFNAHISHLSEANSYLKLYSGEALLSLNESSFNLCARTNSVISGGNSSIADAAVTLAATNNSKIVWDKDGLGSQNLKDNRLGNYKTIKELIFPNDIYFASCDRSAAAAIRWAGADDSFPRGDTGTIFSYLKTNSFKWMYVGDYGKCQILPGDILITKGSGHIKIYVGNAAVQVKYPGSYADMYAASYHNYFPRVYKDQPSLDSRVFAVFRNIKPDNSSVYSNILNN